MEFFFLDPIQLSTISHCKTPLYNNLKPIRKVDAVILGGNAWIKVFSTNGWSNIDGISTLYKSILASMLNVIKILFLNRVFSTQV